MIRTTTRVAAAFVLALLPACAHAQSAAPGAAPAPTARMQALKIALDSMAAAHRGVVGYTVHVVETGEHIDRLGDQPFSTASLIKVPILVGLFDRVEKGELSLDDRVRVLKVDKVPGSGMLQSFHDGLEVTMRDLAMLMITISDNTATNLVLDKVPMRMVWAKMEALGLPRTKIHSKSFQRNTSVAMDSSAKYGLGVTTPNEMARLYALMAQGRAVSPQADSTMLAIMRGTQDDVLLQRSTGGVRAAHKTGATDSVRTECSLWRVPAPVVACVLTKENRDTRWMLDNEAEVLMGRMGAAIVGAWRPARAAASR
jgi:beta-lactamase class A